MQRFFYRARARDGKPLRGEIEAANPAQAKQLLTGQGIILLELGAKPPLALDPEALFKLLRSRLTKVSLDEILVLTQQLQIAYSVGIPLSMGIRMISEQTRNKRLRKALAQVGDDLNAGKFLGESIARHSDIFDSIFIALIKAGEASGQLDSFLLRVTYLLERRSDLQAKVKSAMFYPKMVLTFMLGATLLFVYVIIPKVKEFLAKLGTDLPPITRFVLGTSDFALKYWPLLALGGLTLTVGFRILHANPRFREEFDRFLLRLPAVGKLLLQIELNSFCFIAELLLRSGITIPETLRIVKESLANRAVASELTLAETSVARGGTLSQGLRKSPELPEMFTNLVAMGEESGRLEPVLGKIGEFYRREIDYRLANLSKLIEPILLSIIFVGVGILALAVMLPIWKMTTAIRR
jgi:type II secretory pathway component PulF